MLPQPTATRSPLPGAGELFVTDAGLETELVFKDGLDLPHFSAAVLLETAAGRARLSAYYRQFVDLAARYGRGVLLETPTWRIGHDWGERLGYDRGARSRINHRAVSLLQDLRQEARLPQDRFVVSGNLGPRFDGYRADEIMTPIEARDYHQEQVDDLAEAGADCITAMTITTASEAEGIASACGRRAIPAVVYLTVETDGRLPSGESLGQTIERVDAAQPGAVAWFGINCAHPTHFAAELRSGGEWAGRLGAIRANASRKSHAELDESTELDEGDPDDLAQRYRELLALLPKLRVLGGCCGTDRAHVARICSECAPVVTART